MLVTAQNENTLILYGAGPRELNILNDVLKTFPQNVTGVATKPDLTTGKIVITLNVATGG